MDDWIKKQQKEEQEMWDYQEYLDQMKKNQEKSKNRDPHYDIILPVFFVIVIVYNGYNFIESVIGDYLPHFLHLDAIIPGIVLALGMYVLRHRIVYYIKYFHNLVPKKDR